MKDYLEQRINELKCTNDFLTYEQDIRVEASIKELEKALTHLNSLPDQCQPLKEQIAYLRAELSMKHD